MSILGDLFKSIGSAGKSVDQGLGDLLNSGLDELDLLRRGATEETFNPSQDDRELSQPDRLSIGGVNTGKYLDEEAGSAYEDQNLSRVLSMLGAPIRAVDRASNEYFGDSFTPLHSSSDFRSKANEGQASQAKELDAVETLANTVVDTQEAKTAQKEKKMQIPEVQALMELKNKSKASPENVFLARGDKTLLRAQNPEGDNQIGDTYSKVLRPIMEQQQIRELGKLGISPDRAELMVDNSSQSQGQQIIMDLIKQRSMPMEQKVGEAVKSYMEAVAKAANPQQVQQALIVQLRNIGLQDPQVKLLLQGLGISQGQPQ